MANVLEKIVADKRIEIDALKKQKPLDTFVETLTPSTKNMYDALDRAKGHHGAGFILECKKASPSKGLIREDFDVLSICQTYDKYAAAISVLTDEKYFQGNYEYLNIVTQHVSCPVLNKDFFIDPYQVYLARYYGADAILLMLSVLDDNEYLQLATIAKQLSLNILTEVSTDDELTRAIALDAKLIGINNRNLRDLSTDISRTFEFAPKIPDDRIIISESGIYTNAQVRELAPAVDGFLVGSSVMAQQDIDLACRKLIYGENKVCGLTSVKNAKLAVESGALYGGLIFAEKSARYVTQQQAEDIVTHVPSLNYVGVFVDCDLATVVESAKVLNLYAVQLHGDESALYITELRQELPENCQIWQAAKIESTLVTKKNNEVDHVILDGSEPGSGKAFNWQLITDSDLLFNHCFLAGGLGSETIKQALALQTEQALFGLDINSGVESAPGVKCREKLARTFEQIRNY
ncbi:bifunctional indole-3-glycerol-phosphate synthase TrpC/phosphoribosylanthranilate isomerase TrpF [Thalassotalea sp. 1_MG-2023]|uniref:bifunctional indole-3-glycerol-phosphate synthase TrpC/phosphoribosylanthranilate isomerase TrpF n=1 Tax=Thalassotalea sp. 1_MG-2023 TaxID=3062680 RepID=UPI0026E191A8|nr:bifunctional indole-3-glycerol-phosphate synthase TrpC/phosphoribosylanthranilate isomerase TrpF [Thalassotalea sp. 1_MG-2023]MDO6427305.1 bifunctional indole-3-glycerol-phosphate synthase TrpC/phosphoribosylanthranilate isomerase TrpF [Thalassotalea sp. 1_MG-2023]